MLLIYQNILSTLVLFHLILCFQQPKRWLYTKTSPDGQYRNQTDYILCSQRWRSSIQSAKTRPGADCGSDHEFLIAKTRLKLKTVEKTTRPFRYNLNQIPYDYTVEVTKQLYHFKFPPSVCKSSYFSTSSPTLVIIWLFTYSWEKAMSTHSSTLAWKIHGWRILVGCSPWSR